ncbi:MAG: hypothetical protein ACTHK2_01895 [Dokdonella sp.]|uniref:hypothetical protein n=1 Tax=Dokdonella sp. TaxID=2291710 RepID=UPI003F7F6696
MVKPLVRAALAASLLVFFAGCEQKPAETAVTSPAAAATPDAAILASVHLLKQGDIAGLMQNALPPADFAKAKADWGKDKDQEPITEEQRAQFNETMAKLTAPDAEQKLFAEIEPKLKEFDAQYQQQLPMYAMAGAGWIKNMIQQNQSMSEAERAQATAAVDALQAWVVKTHFTDAESIKKVIAIVAKAARDMNLKSLDEARALTFDESMQKARIAFLGLKDALAVYGFSIDQTLDSIKPQVLGNDGKTASVQLSYTLLGAPLTATTEMVNVDGRWYGKQTIDKLKEKAADQGAATPAAPEAEATPAAEAPKQG